MPILRIANSASPSPLFTDSQFSRGKQEASKTPQKPISENREFKAAPSSHHKFPILARREKRSRKRPSQSKRQSLRIENSAPYHPLSTNFEFSQGKGRSKAQSALQKKTFSEPTYAPSLLLPLPSLKSGSPDKPRGLSIQPCKSEKEEPYICHSSQGRSECLYLRIE